MIKTSQKEKAADPSLKVCANCGTTGAKLTCAKCKATHYCSKACQKQHWKNCHKTQCVTPEERRPCMMASAANKGDRGPADAERNSVKCPICLESFSEGTLCTLPCQHDFHGDCVEELRKQGVHQACPICRVLIPPGPEQLFEDATCLHFRTAGRHRTAQMPWKPSTADEEENMAKVVEMFIAAANQGHIRAHYNLGMIYLNGSGVTEDYEKAVQWTHKAADQGLADAQYKLGFIFLHEKREAQDFKKALHWTHKAADQGHVHAQCSLGALYYEGVGVAQDLKKAIFFLSAAEAQDVEGCVWLRPVVELRKLVEAALRLTASECSGLDAHSPSKCACCGRDADNIVKLKPCPRCMGPVYCGKDCQSEHWKNGHKVRCTKMATKYAAQRNEARRDIQGALSFI